MFCGSEPLSLALREEHGLKIFENRVLKRIFGTKKEKRGMDWRKFHTEEFHHLYFTTNLIMMIKYRSVARCMHRKGDKRIQNVCNKI
jgi:hypothetical protein